MATDLLIETQLAHNCWATRRILEHCQSLPAGGFAQPHDIGPGSIQATGAHIIEAMFFFADIFHEREYHRREHFEQRAQTCAGQLELLARVEPELAASVRSWLNRHALDDPITWPGAPASITTATALVQIFDHGTHHRAQMLNMLRRQDALGDLAVSPILWHADAGHDIA